MRTRKPSLFRATRQQWRRLIASPPVVWDVGAVTTRVLVGQKLVFSQSSCIVLNPQDSTMIAYGDEAYRLLGNSGRHLTVVFPSNRSCVTDEQLLARWLRFVRAQLWPRRRWLSGLRSPQGVLSVSDSVGESDRQVWLSALESAGMNSVVPVSGIVGIGWYLNVARADEPCFVLEMGGSQTQVAILIKGTVFSSKQLGQGGIDLTTQVQSWVFATYHCQVSWRVAEDLKCEYGTLSSKQAGTKKVTLKGKDPYTQLGMTIAVEVSALSRMLIGAQSDNVLFIRQFLSGVTAEVASKSLENGLWLTGGAAQLNGLESWLSVALKSPVSVVREPETAIAKGVAIWQSALRQQHASSSVSV